MDRATIRQKSRQAASGWHKMGTIKARKGITVVKSGLAEIVREGK
jgi:hypothetical protein